MSALVGGINYARLEPTDLNRQAKHWEDRRRIAAVGEALLWLDTGSLIAECLWSVNKIVNLCERSFLAMECTEPNG